MGKAAARSGDRFVLAATITHIYTTSTSPPSTPVNTTCNFSGTVSKQASGNVFIGGVAAAIKNGTSDSGSHTATDTPTVSGSWDNVPTNSATITAGSGTVSINGKAAVRHGDNADVCKGTGSVQV